MYKTIVVKYSPKAKEMAARIEDVANQMEQEGFEFCLLLCHALCQCNSDLQRTFAVVPDSLVLPFRDSLFPFHLQTVEANSAAADLLQHFLWKIGAFLNSSGANHSENPKFRIFFLSAILLINREIFIGSTYFTYYFFCYRQKKFIDDIFRKFRYAQFREIGVTFYHILRVEKRCFFFRIIF